MVELLVPQKIKESNSTRFKVHHENIIECGSKARLKKKTYRHVPVTRGLDYISCVSTPFIASFCFTQWSFAESCLTLASLSEREKKCETKTRAGLENIPRSKGARTDTRGCALFLKRNWHAYNSHPSAKEKVCFPYQFNYRSNHYDNTPQCADDNLDKIAQATKASNSV